MKSGSAHASCFDGPDAKPAGSSGTSPPSGSYCGTASGNRLPLSSVNLGPSLWFVAERFPWITQMCPAPPARWLLARSRQGGMSE